jgi:preprotein translocase subunit YajC
MPDPTLILIAVVLVAFVIFQFRSSRKKAKDAAERSKLIVPGVEIMTNYGLFGTITELDEENNFAFIEISPGNVVKIHRSTILKAADDTVAPETVEELEAEGGGETTFVAPEETSTTTTEPKFGERIEPNTTPESGAAKKVED